jgi:hypothetical protein
VGITILSDTDPAAGALEPAVIEWTRHHAFVKEGKRGCGAVVGDRRCGKAKTHAEHQGAPPSLRILGSGDQFTYQAYKKVWQEVFIVLLEEADLPRPLARVVVEGEATFPDRRKRDQGNHRFFIEKALGDALTEGGWLEDDDWSRYEFGGLAWAYEKGVSRTRLMVFPFLAEDLTQG